MIQTDIYLWEEPDHHYGTTVTIPEDLLEQLGRYAFKYWLDFVTVAMIEPAGPSYSPVSHNDVERFYRAIGYQKETRQ
jgi:hypothetical protein